MTEFSPSDWKFVRRLPGGHRIFEDACSGLYVIADTSGRWPHTTDDGVLYFDFERRLPEACKNETSGRYSVSVPVYKAGAPEGPLQVLVTLEDAQILFDPEDMDLCPICAPDGLGKVFRGLVRAMESAK